MKFLKSFAAIYTAFSLYRLGLSYFGYPSLTELSILQITFIISLSLTLVHYCFMKIKGYSFNKKAIEVKECNLNINQLEDLLLQEGFILKNKTNNSLTLISKGDFLFSFGELIKINFLNEKSILIESKSKYKTTIFDFGKNLDNINTVVSLC